MKYVTNKIQAEKEIKILNKRLESCLKSAQYLSGYQFMQFGFKEHSYQIICEDLFNIIEKVKNV